MRPIEFQILLTLAAGERHGYAIIQDIEDRSHGTVTVETGTLYRALQRLLEGELVRATEPRGDGGSDDERRRYYAITPTGKRAAADEARRMATLVDAARSARLIPETT
jgi:DNA-binding PadR family transcriptional regulator